ncbi:hypothetical protein M514_28333, partial [Trichuris suis]
LDGWLFNDICLKWNFVHCPSLSDHPTHCVTNSVGDSWTFQRSMANCCRLLGAYRSDDDTLYEIQVKPSRAMVNKTCYLGWIAFIICLSPADDDDNDDDTSIVVAVFNFFSLLSPPSLHCVQLSSSAMGSRLLPPCMA